MRAGLMGAALVAVGVLGLGSSGCSPNIHLSDRYGIPERNLFRLQARAAGGDETLAINGEDAERIMNHYRSIMCASDDSGGGGGGGGGGSASLPGSRTRATGGLVMR